MKPIFDIHIFVCTNQRADRGKLSCGEIYGLELVGEFKKQIKNLNVALKVRANKSGCLGICDLGPTIAIYPEGTFYVGVSKQDVTEILEAHLVYKTVIKRLLLEKWPRI